MARGKRKKRGGRWLGLLGLAVLLVILTFIAARLKHAVGPGLSGIRGRPPASLEGFGASLDSMSAHGWRSGRQATADSIPPLWRVVVPPSWNLVSANLAIHRIAGGHGLSVDSAAEDRRRATLVMHVGGGDGPKLRLVVRKNLSGAADGQTRPLLAMVAYEIKGDWSGQWKRLASCPAVMSVVCGRQLGNAGGKEILAFLPLEPKGYPRRDPGPNTVLVDDGPAAMRAKLSRLPALSSGAAALCVHHGSRAVEDERVMAEVARFCAGRGLALVEPVPTARSLASASCRERGIPYFTPDVYLGRSASVSEAGASLRKALEVAESRGRALVLLPATESALKAVGEVFPQGRDRPVQLVPFSRLLPR